MALLDALLEDYGDEWLTKAMFHYRWVYRADIDKGGAVLPLWRNVTYHGDEYDQLSQHIRDRQISRLWVVGSNEDTHTLIEDSYRRFLPENLQTFERQQVPFIPVPLDGGTPQ